MALLIPMQIPSICSLDGTPQGRKVAHEVFSKIGCATSPPNTGKHGTRLQSTAYQTAERTVHHETPYSHMHAKQDDSRDEASVSESSDDEHENWEKADEREGTINKKVNKLPTLFFLIKKFASLCVNPNCAFVVH